MGNCSTGSSSRKALSVPTSSAAERGRRLSPSFDAQIKGLHTETCPTTCNGSISIKMPANGEAMTGFAMVNEENRGTFLSGHETASLNSPLKQSPSMRITSDTSLAISLDIIVGYLDAQDMYALMLVDNTMYLHMKQTVVRRYCKQVDLQIVSYPANITSTRLQYIWDPHRQYDDPHALLLNCCRQIEHRRPSNEPIRPAVEWSLDFTSVYMKYLVLPLPDNIPLYVGSTTGCTSMFSKVYALSLGSSGIQMELGLPKLEQLLVHLGPQITDLTLTNLGKLRPRALIRIAEHCQSLEQLTLFSCKGLLRKTNCFHIYGYSALFDLLETIGSTLRFLDLRYSAELCDELLLFLMWNAPHLRVFCGARTLGPIKNNVTTLPTHPHSVCPTCCIEGADEEHSLIQASSLSTSHLLMDLTTTMWVAFKARYPLAELLIADDVFAECLLVKSNTGCFVLEPHISSEANKAAIAIYNSFPVVLRTEDFVDWGSSRAATPLYGDAADTASCSKQQQRAMLPQL